MWHSITTTNHWIMTRDELLRILNNLHRNRHPLSGVPAGRGSCLTLPPVRRELGGMIDRLASDLPDAPQYGEILDLMVDLRALGYEPDTMQMVKVLTGSRSIADPRLRGLPAYRRYRGVFPQRYLYAFIKEMGMDSEDGPTAVGEPEHQCLHTDDWHTVDFFVSGAFDKLSEGKARSLKQEVRELGLRKTSDRLPAYMVKARQRLPRAFEPWTREERALLIEAMCFTNDLDKLSDVFGRSASSLERQGKQLIWNSRKEAAA